MNKQFRIQNVYSSDKDLWGKIQWLICFIYLLRRTTAIFKLNTIVFFALHRTFKKYWTLTNAHDSRWKRTFKDKREDWKENREGGIRRTWFLDWKDIVYIFLRVLRKIDELLINNSFSVEQAISYFTVTGVSKEVLLCALIIFYLQPAECFFHGLCDSFHWYNCHRLMNKLPVI